MANSMKNLFKTGFGLGLGVMAAQIVFILFGMLFFIPGYLMYNKQKTTDSNSSEQIIGIVLMIIGVVIMGGLGFGLLMDDLGDMF